MDKTKRDTVLGLVFFIGLSLLIAATIALSDLSLKPGRDLTVYFRNARGLNVGDAVLVLGVKAGQVMKVEPEPSLPDYRVKVVMHFENEPNLKADARFDIRDANFLGGKQIEIDPGRAPEPADFGKIFRGEDRANAFDRVADMLTGKENGMHLQGVLSGVNEFFRRLNEDAGSVQSLMKTTDLYDEIRDFVSTLQKAVKPLNETRGVAGRIINDDELGKKFDSILTRLERTTTQIEAGKGPVGALIYDEKLAKDLRQVADDVAQLTKQTREGKGALGMLLNDEAFKSDIRSAAKRLDSTLAKLDDPKSGILGALVSDPKMLETGRRLLDNLAQVSDELRNGDGLLARLVREKEMGEQFERVLNQVSRAVEDAREAAPVGTFFQVFAGAF